MQFKHLIFSLVFLLTFSSISALNISGCLDINSTYINQELVLIQDLNDWNNNSCFNITAMTLATDYFELDCNNHKIIDTNDDVAFFNQNSKVLDRITFRRCDFDLQNIYLSDAEFMLNAEFNKFEFVDTNISIINLFYLSSLNFSDFNLTFNNSIINANNIIYLAAGNTISNLDLNATNSIINTTDLLYLASNNIISNLDLNFPNTLINFNSILDSVSSNNKITNIFIDNLIGSADTLIRGAGSDLNYISVFNSNIQLSSSLFIIGSDSFIDFNFYNVVLSSDKIFNFESGSTITTLNVNNLDLNTDSQVLTDFFYLNNTKITNFNMLNSDINLDSGFNNFLFFRFQDDSITQSLLDLNFYNSQINIDPTYVFYFYRVDVNNIIISNLDINSSGTIFRYEDYIFLKKGDLNYISILNSDINSYYNFFQLLATKEDAIDINFFGTTLNFFDDSEGFVFENDVTDVNYLYIRDLNLNQNTNSYNSSFLGLYKDLDYICIFDSNFNINNGALVSYHNTDTFLDFNFLGSLFYLDNNSTMFSYISAGSLNNNLNLHNLDLNLMNQSSIFKGGNGSRVYNIVFENLDVNLNNSFVLDLKNATNDLNLDFSNNLFNFYNNSSLFFSDFLGTPNSASLFITGLDFNSNYYLGIIQNNGFNISITDSNLNLDRLFYVDSTSTFNASIYNNKIVDSNYDNNLIDCYGTCTIDFNTDYNSSNYEKRILLLPNSSDSNATGGNLWLDSLGNNLCTLDIVVPFGICDLPIEINGTDKLYYDHLSLRDYNATLSYVDLIANLLDFNNSKTLFKDYLDINFGYANYGNTNTSLDYNVIYEINNIVVANYLFSSLLTSGSSDYNSYVWVANDINNVDFNVCVIYSGTDNDLSNDCIQDSLIVYYRDVNVNSITLDPNPTYGEDTNIVISIGNNGTYDSNNVSVQLDINGLDENGNNATITIDFGDVNLSENSNSELSEIWDVNLIGNLDFNLIVTPTEQDYNNTNDFNYSSAPYTSIYVDLNVETQVQDVNAGHSVDINCLVSNNGDANAEDYNVYLYVNNVIYDFNIIESLNAGESNNQQFSWTPTAKEDDLNIGCVVIYSGTDYNSNDSTNYIDFNIGSDSNVDLLISDIRLSSTTAGAVTVTVDVNNVGDANTVDDYNVRLYVDSVLLSYNDLNTEIDINSQISTTFSWTSTAGTHTLNAIVDYNINNYSGYDQNIDNNNYSESFTITSGTTGPGGGGGGGGTSETKTYNVRLSSNYSGNLDSNDGITIISNISKIGTKNAESLTYKILALKGTNKVELYSQDVSANDVEQGKTITKEILLNDLTDNLIEYMSNDKITLITEIDSVDDTLTDNTKTLLVSVDYFDLKINSVNASGILTSRNNVSINGSITKLGAYSNNVEANLYLISGDNEKLINKQVISNYPGSYNYSLGLYDLFDNLDLIDSNGYANLLLEINSNDLNINNNSKEFKVKLEYFNFEINPIRLNNIELNPDSRFNFDIEKTYYLEYSLDYISINKLGNAKIFLDNISKDRLISSKSFSLGSNIGNTSGTIQDKLKINLLTLMSKEDAELVIKSLFNLNNSQESKNKIDLIMSKLGLELNLQNNYLHNDTIYLLDNSDDISVSLSGSDLDTKFNYTFSLDYFGNLVNVDANVAEKNEMDNKNISGEELIEKQKIINEKQYILKYKQKLGLEEIQEIYVYDLNNNPEINLSLLIDNNNSSWYLITDNNGKALFDPEKIGLYSIAVPYPNSKIKAQFEVLNNYTSSNMDFIELNSQNLSSESSNKTYTLIFSILGIIIIIVLAIVLYLLLKPKKKEFYDFSSAENYEKSDYYKMEIKKEIVLADKQEKLLYNKLKSKIK